MVHQEPLHGGISNKYIHNEYETYRQDFECEGCIDKVKTRSKLMVHKETSHEDFVTNSFLNWSQPQYMMNITITRMKLSHES